MMRSTDRAIRVASEHKNDSMLRALEAARAASGAPGVDGPPAAGSECAPPARAEPVERALCDHPTDLAPTSERGCQGERASFWTTTYGAP